MGQKVNYNKKKNNKLKIIGIIILSLLALLIVIKSFRDALKSVNEPNNVANQSGISGTTSRYGTLEDLFSHYDCRLISKQETSELLSAKVSFKCDLYTGDTSNENFFINLCKDVAEFEKYRNLELKDNDKNITIEVKCEDTNIVEFKINGDVNYYLNAASDRNRNKYSNSTNFTIQSTELQELNDSNWSGENINFGTKESTCFGYDIYFDEGIKIQTVGRNIFNIVFTNNYKGQVAGELTTMTTPSQVISALGEPTFEYMEYLYGYIGEKDYLFFDFMNNQISLYPIIELSAADEKNIETLIEQMNETLDIKAFATNLVNLWGDYDVYNYDSNYVDLKYTLKGVELSMYESSLKNGIYIYQNYLGDRSIANLDNVYMMDTDAIYDSEYSRMMVEANKSYGASQMGYEPSGEYYVELIESENYGIIKGRFISINGNRADVEINDSIYTYAWMSDTELLYSVQGKGIYYYNFDTFTKQLIIEGSEDYNIKSYENNILSYDGTATRIEK